MDAPYLASDVAITTPMFRRDRVWTTFAVVAASLVTFMAASLVMTVIASVVVHGMPTPAKLRDPEFLAEITRSRIGFMLVVIIPQLALIVPCLVAAFLSPIPIARRLGLVRGHWPYWAWACAMFATPLIGTLSALLGSVFLEESQHLKDLGGIFRDHGESGFLIPMALMIGVTPAVCEELLFRGYIQTRLSRAIGPLFGITLASILFAAFHLDFVHVVSVFPIGVFLGWISFRSGSLVPAMLGHFLNNALGVVIMVNAPADETDTLALPAAVFLTWILFAGILGVLGTIVASYLYAPIVKRAVTSSESISTEAVRDGFPTSVQQDSINGEPAT